MQRKIIIILCFLAFAGVAEGQEFGVMFYNVENLFDTKDDTTKNDEEFLPEGSRHWTNGRYWKKLTALAQAITVTGQWELPALVGLCEVENEEVVKDLAYGTMLSAGNYGIAHRESPDRRGIDLALLYNRDLFRIIEVRSWVPERADDDPFVSRNLLYAKTVTAGDTLHVIVCHLPSRRGGVLAAEGARKEMAMLVMAKTDSIIAASPHASVVVMGDFNAGGGDETMKIIKEAGSLINAAGQYPTGKGGSYKYQGTWEIIDQILVSPSMTDNTGPFIADLQSFRISDAPILMIEDPAYPGMKPFPTYSGYKWAGGPSDHLPVMITIDHKSLSPGR